MIHTKKYASVSNDIANDFSAGLLASTIASTGDLSGITSNAAFEFGTAFLPAPDGPGCRPVVPAWRSRPVSPTSGRPMR